MAAHSSNDPIFTSPILWLPDLAHLTADKNLDVDKTLDDIKTLARTSLKPELQQRWNDHEEQLAPIAVDLATIGRMRPIDACTQAALVHHKLTERETGYFSRIENKDLPCTAQTDAWGEVCWIHINDIPALGSGAFGKVRLSMEVRASRKPGESMTVSHRFVVHKKAKLHKDHSLHKVQHEFNRLRSLAHVPYVVKPIYFSSYWSSKHNIQKTGLVMEYANAGTLTALTKIIRKLPPKERWTIFLQVVEGLAGIHAAGITHRDLTSDNILLTWVIDPATNQRVLQPRIGDLASSHKRGERDESLRTGGTTWYKPPEFVKRRKDVQLSWSKSDVWQLALIGLGIFGGVKQALSTFDGGIGSVPVSMLAIEVKGQDGCRLATGCRNIPEAIQPVLLKMMKYHPDARASLKEILPELQAAVHNL